jgi:hypothetical protein
MPRLAAKRAPSRRSRPGTARLSDRPNQQELIKQRRCRHRLGHKALSPATVASFAGAVEKLNRTVSRDW